MGLPGLKSRCWQGCVPSRSSMRESLSSFSFPRPTAFLGLWGSHQLYLFIYLFPFIFISWRLITLQYCGGFCHTLTWISHGFTCVPHPDPPSHLPLHPVLLGLPSAPGPSTCLTHPAWATDRFTLDNIHVLMLFSWNIPPSPSSTESKRLFYKFVSFFFFLFCI